MTSLSTGWSSFLYPMQHYNKPYLPIPKQVALLEERGLIVTDRVKAEHYLSKVGYYRLSGYSYVFRKSAQDSDGSQKILDDFKEGVKFDDILALYIFDKRLRMALLRELSKHDEAGTRWIIY